MRAQGTACLAVGLGGGIGAVARFALQQAFGAEAQGFSLALVNIVGCFLIGFLTHRKLSKNRNPLGFAFVVTGMLGGFTSFSAFMVIVASMANQEPYLVVVTYAVGYFAMCVLAVALGRTASKLRNLDLAEAAEPKGRRA